MDDRQADLFADSGLAGADRFNILLIEHDVIGLGAKELALRLLSLVCRLVEPD